MNVLDLAQRKVKMRKASGTNGGEWQGPCPGCGGEDRFHVWPAENDGRGGYWCRQCEKTGDNIQFLREFDGMGFKEACAELGIAVQDRPVRPYGGPSMRPEPPGTRPGRPDFSPEAHPQPADSWRERAERFVSWAEENLKRNGEVIKWLSGRGIGPDAAVEYRLGWNPGENGKDIYRPRKSWGLPDVLRADGKPKALWIPVGLVIPCISAGAVCRVRIRRPEGEPRYYVLPGSSMATYIAGRDRRAFVVVESELDAIACASACKLAGSVAMGSVAAKPDAEAWAVLTGSVQILNALDYDDAGAKAMAWWAAAFGDRCVRWPVPKGKDPGDAARSGIDLNEWIKAGLPPALTIEGPDGKAGRQEKPVETGSGGEKSAGRGVDKAPAGKTLPGASEAGQNGSNAARSGQSGLMPALAATAIPDGTPEAVRELYGLLRKNPAVRIVNEPGRLAVLRDGKYVGGRIAELVFRVPEVTEYITNHPDAEIAAGNLLTRGEDES